MNASTIFTISSGMSLLDASEVDWDLAEPLVLPFAIKRKLLRLSNRTQLLLSLLDGDANLALKTSSEERPAEQRWRRCHPCIAGIVGKPRYKDRLPKMKT